MRTRTGSTIGGIIGAAAALVLMAPLAAHATDAKFYGSTGCKPWGINNGPKVNYGVDGSAMNNSDGTLYLICPVVRDVMGESMERVTVWVHDNNPDSDIYCYFKALYDQGNAYYTKTMRSSGTGFQAMSVTRPGCSGNCIGDPPGLSYSMYCSVPRKSGNSKSGLIKYRVDERT